jgi:hypothetical protein
MLKKADFHGFWYTLPIYVQFSLVFTLIPFITNIYTTCFGLIGHLQVYKLALHCRSLEGNRYWLALVMLVKCSHTRVQCVSDHQAGWNELSNKNISIAATHLNNNNSVASVRERTIPTERSPLVGEFSTNILADRGCRVVSAANPNVRNLDFPDRSRYYFFQVAPQLYSRGWMDPVPVPNHWICSQELWPLDHRDGPSCLIRNITWMQSLCSRKRKWQEDWNIE